LVILFHGYSAEKTSLLGEARAFLDLGASALLVDFRGSGGSSESYTTVGVHEAEDVAAAMGFARERLSHGNVFLFGRSMGAAAILRAVHAHGTQPDGVILEAVFDTLLNTVRHRFRAMELPAFPSAELLVFWGGRQWGFDGFGHNPSDYAASVHCPALLMHGERDPRVRLTEARRVFEAIPGLKEFVTFQQSGHESYLSDNANPWRNAVERFIKRSGKSASSVLLKARNCATPRSHH
jgi:pimeloyl-ACP methyl ester carboxylesterase